VQPLLSSLQAELNIGYLDDVMLGGQVEMVASDVAEIVRAGSELGLSLNVDNVDLQVNDTLLQSITRAEISNTTLLKAPLFPGPALDSTWYNKHCEDLARAVDHLCSRWFDPSKVIFQCPKSSPSFEMLSFGLSSVTNYI